MLPPRLILSTLSISLYLLMYYAAVSFFPLYLSSIFKFSVAEANGLVSIFWTVNVVAAVVVGFVSDRTLVRKPYMLLGAIATIIVTLLFISRIGQPTGAGLMAVFLSLFGITLRELRHLGRLDLAQCGPLISPVGLLFKGGCAKIMYIMFFRSEL